MHVFTDHGNVMSAERELAILNALTMELFAERRNALSCFIESANPVSRIIKSKNGCAPEFFNTSEEFGAYVLQKKGASFCLELEDSINTHQTSSFAGDLEAFGVITTVFRKTTKEKHPDRIIVFDDASIELRMRCKDEYPALKIQISPDSYRPNEKRSFDLLYINVNGIPSQTAIVPAVIESELCNATSVVALDCCNFSDDKVVTALLTHTRKFKRASRIFFFNEGDIHHLSRGATSVQPTPDLQELPAVLGGAGALIFSGSTVFALDGHNLYSGVCPSPDRRTLFKASFCRARLLNLDTESCVLFASLAAGNPARTIEQMIELLYRRRHAIVDNE